MVGRAAGEEVGGGVDALDFEVGGDEDVVELADGQEGRKSFERDVVGRVGLDVAEGGVAVVVLPAGDEAAVEFAAGGEIEIAKEEGGAVGGDAAEEVVLEEAVDLRGAFVVGEAEVGGDDGDLAVADGEGGVEAVARFDDRHAAGGEAGLGDEVEGAGGEQAVAVAFLAVYDGGAEELVKAEFGGEDGELVVAAGSGAADVEFLKGDEVGIEDAEDAGDAVGGEAAVETFAVMDVVGDDAEVGGGGARAAAMGGAPGAG